MITAFLPSGIISISPQCLPLLLLLLLVLVLEPWSEIGRLSFLLPLLFLLLILLLLCSSWVHNSIRTIGVSVVHMGV